MGFEESDKPLRLSIQILAPGSNLFPVFDLLVTSDNDFAFIHWRELFAKFLRRPS